jgi:Zn-dependent M28 family amino/carboxypeptidase
MTDIGARKSVPAANDNGTAVVALLDLARRFLADPPQGIRVILLSTGSEESFSEGMKAFGERHFDELPRDRTFFLCLETLGATHLLALQGEGFLKMRDYPPRALAFVERIAGEEGIWLYPNLRTYNGTDALEPRVAGYETVALCSCTDQKQPGRYHWPNDVAENVNFSTVQRAIDLSDRAVRQLGERWL